MTAVAAAALSKWQWLQCVDYLVASPVLKIFINQHLFGNPMHTIMCLGSFGASKVVWVDQAAEPSNMAGWISS